MKMGIYLNPGNEGFKSALRSQIYVDKTGLLEYTNSVLDTEQRWVCVSRPRRFGKSMAAEMLVAYYDKSCDSKEMFQDLKIAESKEFEEHLNRYDMIHVDVNSLCHKRDRKTGREIDAKEVVNLFHIALQIIFNLEKNVVLSYLNIVSIAIYLILFIFFVLKKISSLHITAEGGLVNTN